MQLKSWISNNDFIYSRLMRMNMLSWRTKLLTLFTMVLVASLLLQVFYIVPFIQDREVENAEHNQTEIVYAIVREIDIGLKRLAQTLESIAEQTVIRTMDVENQLDLLEKYTNISNDITSLFVMNKTGWYVSGTVENFAIFTTKSYDYIESYNVSFKQSEVFYSTPRSYYNNTLVSSYISVPIVSEFGEKMGVLVGTMTLNDLIQRIAAFPLDKEQILHLVNSEGIVIAHSEINVYPLEQGQALLLNYSSLYSVKEMMNGSVNGTYHSEINGTDYCGSYAIIDSTSWGVTVETPTRLTLLESNILVQNLWFFNLVLFSSALVITLIFTQQIAKQQKSAEDQLIRNERLAILGKLAGGISHELRNPLGAIKNSVYFLKMVLEKPEPDVKASLEILDKEIVTAEKIINNILDFARSKPSNMSNVDINNLIQITLSKITVPDNIKVINQLDKALVSIQADPDQLTQVLNNIITNAIQAMPEGGQMVIKSENSSPNWVMISIKDTGVGIPKENLDQLFEPLFTTKAKGIGLGLAITKTLVENHGGTIEAQGEIGRGSTFTLKLPISNNGG